MAFLLCMQITALSCAYLAHRELQGVLLLIIRFIIVVIIIVTIITAASS